MFARVGSGRVNPTQRRQSITGTPAPKVALVTGAASGIGRAAALAFVTGPAIAIDGGWPAQ